MTEYAIGAVLSDVDGTQIRHGHSLPSPEVQAAARGLREHGIPLLEVTARPHALIKKLIEPLDLRDNLCTLDGGATVAQADSGEVLWSHWLNSETTWTIVSAIGRLCTDVHFFDKSSQRRKPLELVIGHEGDETSAIGAPSVFAIFGVERGTEIVEALGTVTGIGHTPVMRYEDSEALRCIQVFNTGVNKQYGIVQMLRLAGLTDQRLLAIGDGTNDLSLFAAAGENGIRVAMGNAPDELKDLADWVAPPVEDHGFAVAMERYRLLA